MGDPARHGTCTDRQVREALRRRRIRLRCPGRPRRRVRHTVQDWTLMPTPVPDRRQPTMNTCPPRRSARKTLLYGLASDYTVDNGTGRTLTASYSLARRPVPSRWVIDNRCSAMDLNEMRCVKVVVPQPPPPSFLLDPPTPQRLDERHGFFYPRPKFSRHSKRYCSTTHFRRCMAPKRIVRQRFSRHDGDGKPAIGPAGSGTVSKRRGG